MRATMGMGTMVGVALLALATTARADEKPIAVDALPQAVRKAVQVKFPKGKIEKAAREEEDGETVFEVTLKVDEDRIVDVALSPVGKILEIERLLMVDELPEEVRESLTRRFPGAKIEKVESVWKGGDDDNLQYEVLLSTEVLLNAKGEVTRVKQADQDDEDDDRD